MASGTNTSVSKIAYLAVVIPILIVLWFAAPWFLPMWRWQSIDFAALAKQNSIPESQLRQEFDFLMYYNARQPAGDPSPWQIVTCSPEWRSIDPKNNDDEHDLLVRCTLLSDHDGEPFSKLWIGASREEHFVKVRGWRFPPGSFGKNPKRPVIVYRGNSWEFSKLDMSEGIVTLPKIAGWENDDHWRDREDGWGQR